MKIEDILRDSKFARYKDKFLQEGVSKMEDIRDLKKNGKLIELAKSIVDNQSEATELKDYLQSKLDKAGIKMMLFTLGIPTILLIIIILTLFS